MLVIIIIIILFVINIYICTQEPKNQYLK